MPESPQVERIRLADLIIDTGTRQVWRDGLEIPLTGLSFDLLRAFIEAGTRVVSTDELMERVWPGRVVNAETVAKRVELVREALGDNSQEPRYIALVRGRGYRLLHAPQPAGPTRADPGRAPDPQPGPASAAPEPYRRRRAWIAGGITLVLLAAVAIGILVNLHRDERVARGAAANAIPSVAVLPFLNLSEDAANSYFSDGMAEELLGTLSKLRGLRVASRTSAFTFRGSSQPLPEIARALNVDNIVEGSVRKSGNRIRVTVQLIDVRSDSHLWTETYDRELSDVFEIQRDISERIADALKMELAPGARETLGPGTHNAEAWQLYLRGNQLWQARTEESIRQSIGLLRRAIDLDPAFAQAHASLAAAYWVSFFWFSHPEASAFDHAREAAKRAIELDPTLSQPYAVLGALAEANFEWSLAETQFRYALKLNPNDAQAGYWLAEMLGLTGRTREALAMLLEYEKLDPISFVTLHDIGIMYGRLGDEAHSCAYLVRATEIGGSPYVWLRVAECRRRAGNFAAMEDAERNAQRLLNSEKPILTLVRQGRTDPAAAREARAAIEQEVTRQRIYPARFWMELGDLDAAVDSIERNVLRHDINAMRDLWWRDGADLRAHPRFRPFIERIGLVEYWRAAGWPDVCRPAGESFTCD
jgi:TolB-like protein/DNA-binding winged helix-turn-helix (wHTH) protein